MKAHVLGGASDNQALQLQSVAHNAPTSQPSSSMALGKDPVHHPSGSSPPGQLASHGGDSSLAVHSLSENTAAQSSTRPNNATEVKSVASTSESTLNLVM